jgi:glycosyltransferase involved in cell wall biosynthesis
LTLSVCIPIYNTDVRALVEELCAQISKIQTAQIDIMLIDDASDVAFRQRNQYDHPKVHFIQLETNIGRSRIRNTFLKYTNAEYLLFIDGDSTVLDPSFLKQYVAYLLQHQNMAVLVGASVYQDTTPDLPHRLRWKYSTSRESLSYEQRKKLQDAGFKTNNFLIRRSVFEKLPFEEKLLGYGHEDTLFGLQLVAKGIRIEHIDNPVWNFKLDTNSEFLKKTDNAIANLLWICANYKDDLRLVEKNKLLRYFISMKSFWLGKFALGVLAFHQPLVSRILQTGLAPLFLFDLYRLGSLYQLNKDPQYHLR